jgi:hypothetical protein
MVFLAFLELKAIDFLFDKMLDTLEENRTDSESSFL